MPRNFYDEGCCGEDTGGSIVNAGACVFPTSFRFPNRTTFTAAGPCAGPGNTFFDPVDNAIKSRFNATSGPILQVPPPANTSPSPVPIGAVDDGVNPPVLAPLNTVSATPFGDLSDAILRLGTPSAGAPTLAASRITIDPRRDSVTVAPTLTVHRNSAIGAGNPDGMIVDFTADGGPGTLRTFIVRSSDAAFQADFTAEGVANGFLGVHSGPAGGPKIRITQTSAPAGFIRNDQDGPGGDLLLTASGILDLRDTTNIGSTAATQVVISSAVGQSLITNLGGNLTIDTAGTTVVIDAIADIGETDANRVRINSNSITTANGGLTISSGTLNITLTPAGGFVTFTVPGPGALQPAVASQGDLGTVALPWRNLNMTGTLSAITTLTVTTITTPAATDLTITPLGNDVNITNADVNPTTDGTRDLGDAAHRWASLFLATGIFGTGSLIVDMNSAGATTLTVTNTGLGAASLFVDANITMAGTLGDVTTLTVTNVTTPAATRLTLTSLEPATGGADIGVIINASNLGTVAADKIVSFRTANVERAFVGADGTVNAGGNAAILSSGGVGAFVGVGTGTILLGSNGGGGGGNCFIQDSTSITGTLSATGTINSSGGDLQTNSVSRITNAGAAQNLTTVTGSGNFNSTGGAIQTNSTTRITNAGALTNITTITASGNIDTTGGELQTNTTTRITNGGVTNNLTMDANATGCSLLMKTATSVANNRELVIDETSAATPQFIYQDSTGTEHTLLFT